MLKVKAHSSLNEEGLSRDEMARRLGNHSADLGAKSALAFNPRDGEVLEETGLSVKFAPCHLQTCCEAVALMFCSQNLKRHTVQPSARIASAAARR